MENSTQVPAGLIESGYYVSLPLFWGGALVLVLLLLAWLWSFARYRRGRQVQETLLQELREGADSFLYLVETAHEGIAVVQNARLVYLNPRMCEMSGYTENELKALPSFLPLIHPSAQEEIMANYQRRVAGKEAPQRYESLFLRKDGTSYPIELSGVAIVWGGQPATLNLLTDISARKAAETKVAYLAHHDSLTGLVNRLVLHDHIKQALALAERNNDTFAVLFIDLDGFKQINDTYGHEVGDILLKQVTARIKKQLRDTDTFARIGGDEFVVLLAQTKNIYGVKQTMGRIEEVMVEPFHINDYELHCHVSQGAALYPEDGTTEEQLLSQADKKMYTNKCAYHANHPSQSSA